MSDLGADLRALIVAIVDERLRERGLGSTAARFTAEHLPPHVSRRVFVEACAAGKVEGAEKHGRLWTCTASAWFAARSNRPAPAARLHLVHDVDEPSVQDCIDSALERARGSR